MLLVLDSCVSMLVCVALASRCTCAAVLLFALMVGVGTEDGVGLAQRQATNNAVQDFYVVSVELLYSGNGMCSACTELYCLLGIALYEYNTVYHPAWKKNYIFLIQC